MYKVMLLLIFDPPAVLSSVLAISRNMVFVALIFQNEPVNKETWTP